MKSTPDDTDQNEIRIERATIRLWPEAGRTVGLGRAATYEAAKGDEIPVLKIGRRPLVPRPELERLLDDLAANRAAAA